jgi:hypothetical protein
VLETWKPYQEKAASQTNSQANKPKVALLADTEPVQNATGWQIELLASLGGVPCELSESPDILIIAIPDFTLEEAHFAAQVLFQLPEWGELPCVQVGDCYVVDAPMFFTTPTVEAAQILATILYPEAFPESLPPYSVRILEREKEPEIEEIEAGE